jgi:hypothetical protein
MNSRFNLLYRLFAICSMYLISSCNDSSTTTAQNDDINQYRDKEKKSMVAWGNYLVTIGGCNDSHSPKNLTPQGPMIDSSKMLSGHPAFLALVPFDKNALTPNHWIQMSPDLTAYVGPWGISYAANLTPDSTTGIGAWTEDVFIKTLRTGKHLGQEKGRDILPPMPWPEIAQMSDDDLRAVYQYLSSLPPINNRVPSPVPPEHVRAISK